MRNVNVGAVSCGLGYTLEINLQKDGDIAQTLRACLETGASEQWEKFSELAHPVIAAAVSRTMDRWGRSDRSAANDLIQDTFARLLSNERRALRNFRGEDPSSLYAYLRVIAASVVTDHLRGDPPPAMPLDDPERAPVIPDNTSPREIEKNLLLARVEKCLATQKDRDRRIFWLYHRHGFTPKHISALPAIEMGISGVETLVYRLTRLVADCMKKTNLFRMADEGGRA